MYSATEEGTYWDPTAGLTRSDSVSMKQDWKARGVAIPGPWGETAQQGVGSIPKSPSWSQASCGVLCQEEHVSLLSHLSQHFTQSTTPFLVTSSAAGPRSVQLWVSIIGAQRQNHVSRNSSAFWQHSGARGAAGQGGVRQTCASLSHLSTSAGGSALPAQQYFLGHPQTWQVQGQAEGAHGYPLNFSALPWWTGALTHQFEMWLDWSLPASHCKLLMSMAVSIVSSAIKI